MELEEMEASYQENIPLKTFERIDWIGMGVLFASVEFERRERKMRKSG